MLLAVPFGVLIGLVVGTVGGGGAILALPVLVYVLDQGVSPASTASLIVVALGASVGAGAQARRGRLCPKVVVFFSVPAIAVAYLGAVANDAISARALILAFIPVMLAAAALTYARGADDDGDEERGCPEVGAAQAGSCGIVVGVMTGFFGVGGGFLIVPALANLLGLPVRRAIATSLAIITVTSVGAVASHLIEGNQPDWPLTAVLCISAVAGALAGSALGQRLQPRQLANAFAAVVAGIAVFLLIDVLALGGPPTS